jgi:serine/threonine protein kinase/tetratricopeptide (TPR) repeat protein
MSSMNEGVMNANPARAKEIFVAALKRPAEQWDAYLEEVCGGDGQLRQRVHDLLQVHAQPGSLFESPDAAPVATIDEGAVTERPGTVIGPYKLLEQIGEGGFGVVYMAEQTQPVRRKVALKVLKPGMDTRQVIARFEAERQALALMDHPNIARVFDAGSTPSGRPYFVMELVKGVPITEFCDQNQLTPRQRLELFLPVCQAVQHAHQKGIIHRDLKPSNVLVSRHDTTPVVKVIDFGVAKALGQELTDKTLFTGVAQMIGTPLYMSPEQAGMSDLDIDTRSDIYSLGVLLYELLTGTTPFRKERFNQVGYDELRRIIREEEPPRPSTRISTLGQAATTVSTQRQSDPRRLSRLFRGDLDWIVMKALEKDRNRRYETASAFAVDVQRYLDDEPVLACPPSAWYRLRKFVLRNQSAVTVAAVILVLVLAGTAASTWQAVRATRAEQRTSDALADVTSAQAQTREALDALTDDVVETMFARQPELEETEKAFLRKVLGHYEAVALRVPQTAEAQFLRAKGCFKVAHLRELLGEQAEAVAGYRQAALLLEQLAGEFPDVAVYRHKLARTNGNLGVLLAESGQEAEAETAFRQGIALRTKLAEDFPKVPEYRSELARNYNDLAFLLERQEKYEQAARAYHEALDRHEKLVAEWSGVPAYHQHLARTRSNLGGLLRKQAKYPEAEPLYRQALKVQEEQLEKFPTVPRCRRQLADSYQGFGILLAEMHNLVEAEKALRRAVTLREKLTADFPRVAKYRQELARTYGDLGNLLRAAERTAEAEAAWRSAGDLWEQLAAAFPETPDFQNELARMLGTRAAVHVQRKEFAAAVALLEQARPHNLAALEAGPKNEISRRFYHNTLATMTQCHWALGDHARLAAAVEELVRLDYKPASDPFNAAICLSRCIMLIDKDGQLAEGRRKELAQKYADRALALLRQAVARGFKDAARIKENPSFQPLRERDEFQKLLVDMRTRNGD